MGISLVKFVSHMFWIHDQHLSTQKLYQNGLFIKWLFDGRPISTFSPLIQKGAQETEYEPVLHLYNVFTHCAQKHLLTDHDIFKSTQCTM